MSGFIVSARKYRPTRFEDVVGQGHVVKTLKNAIRNDQLAHSFLFTGPRGVGKTTCARILARIINADDPVAAADEAPDAASLEGANPFNIYEIDAASNNSVEDIRTLTEQVRFPPQSGKYKVFIIDEVHMLSQAAFNAFLKTLEEPPPYAVFILATTEKHKIIPTILSRCQIFDFSRIRVPEIVAHLEKISTSEGVTYEDDGLHIIAQKADGALRDALSMYDRILSYTGGSITLQEVLDNLNILDYDYFFGLTDAFLTEDLSRVLHTYSEILDKGFEGDAFLTGIAEHFRNLLVARDPATLDLLELTGPLKARYGEQAALCSPSFLVSALGVMNTCDIHYKAAKHKRLHVEMSLVKLTYLQRAVGVATELAPAKKKPSPEIAVEPLSAKLEAMAPAATQEAETSIQAKPEPQPERKAESVEPPASEMKTAPAELEPEPASGPVVQAPKPASVEQPVVDSAPSQEVKPENREAAETAQAPTSQEAQVQAMTEEISASTSPSLVADQSEAVVAASEAAAETATAVAEPAPDATPRKVVDLPTSQPGIRVPTLADLARQVDEEKQQAEQDEVVLEVEGKRTLPSDVLETGWKAFGEAIAGEKMAVAKLVEAARLEAHDGGLRILVENSIQQELIREELPGYRAHLPSHGKGAGSIQVEVKPSDQPASARVPYTSKERLERMAEKNPELNNLQQTLGLDFDY